MTDAEEKLQRIREGARKGGSAKGKKGFAANPKLASEAGRKGALASNKAQGKGHDSKQER